MYNIETTEDFDDWIKSLRDGLTQKIILKRIRSMSLGSLGETRSLTGGLFEVKINYAPASDCISSTKEKR